MTQRQKELAYALGAAALLIALPLLGKTVDPDGGLGARLYGITMGLVLAAYGNIAPRQLIRYDPKSPRQALIRQTLLRFTGRVFVLAGFGHALIWAFAPIDRAALWSIVPVAAGVVLVGFRCARAMFAATRNA